MAEIAVNLKGQDNLTKSVKNATKAVDDLKYSSTELGKCYKEFDRITQSGKSLKGQLNQLKALMANMNMKGLANTDEFTKIAQKAGEIKDAIADASDAVSRFSSDTLKLDAAIQAVQGVAAAASIATGAMALFGKENDDVAKAILKVQSALAILNGVQSISNILNKDSALMMRIKQIRLAATTAATTSNTVATTANTAATVANTVAQKAWNVAKAVGKALFGDFSGLLLVGVAGLAAYSIATMDATDAEKKRNKALEEGKRLAKERADNEKQLATSIASSASNQIGAYLKLQQKWRECGTDIKKQQEFLKAYKTDINNTGFAVNTLTDAENFFVKNTNAVIQAIMKRAEAQANYELMVEKLKKGIEKVNEKSIKSGAYYQTANEKNLTEDEKKYLQGKYGNDWREKKWTYSSLGTSHQGYGAPTKEALAEINKLRKQQAIERNKTWQQSTKEEMAQEVNSYLEAYKKADGDAAKILKDNGFKAAPHGSTTTKTPKTPKTKTDKTDKKDVPDKGTVGAMEKEVEELNKKLKNKLLPKKEVDRINARIKELKKKIEDEKIRLELEKKPAKESLSDLEEQFNKLHKSMADGLVKDENMEAAKKKYKELKKAIEDEKIRLGFETSEMEKKLKEILKKANEDFSKLKPYKKQESSFEKARTDTEKASGYKITNQGRLEELQKEMDYNDELIKQLQTLFMLYTQLGNVEGMKKVGEQLGVVSKKQQENINQAKQLQKQNIDWETQQTAMQGVAEVAGYLGNSMQAVGNVFTAVGAESAAAMMEMVATTAQGVSQVIPQIMALIAAKQGEALASGTASAAAMPFPANIAAIAAVVATIISTFAGIISAATKFAEGGIVGGGSPHGDKMLVRVNSGEMILNGKQQKRLFDLLDSGGAIGGQSQSVEFKIKGQDLYGTLKNYSNIKSKVGKTVL